MDRKNQLERMIMGLEQSIESTKSTIPYYRPDDLELVYAKKFLASAQDNLAKAKKELDEMTAAENPPKI